MSERTNIKQGKEWIGRREGGLSLFPPQFTCVLFKILQQACIHIFLW